MDKLIELKVTATDKTNKDGQKYVDCRTFAKNGDRMRLAFTQQCMQEHNLVLKSGRFILVVKPTDINVSHKKYTPCVWVRNYVEIKDGNQATQADLEKIAELFGQDENDNE